MDEYNRLFDNDKLLEPGFMISMYARGSFPMAEEDGTLNWYLPQTRAVIPVSKFNIPRTLKKFMQSASFEYRFNSNILSVIKNCSKRNETWISSDLIDAYKRLINLGYVHSVEVYQKDELVGGLYGIAFRGAFFGAGFVGLFEMGITFLLWNKGLELSNDKAKTATLAYLAPFLSIVFITFILGEIILPSSIIGLALIVGGIIFQNIKKTKI